MCARQTFKSARVFAVRLKGFGSLADNKVNSEDTQSDLRPLGALVILLFLSWSGPFSNTLVKLVETLSWSCPNSRQTSTGSVSTYCEILSSPEPEINFHVNMFLNLILNCSWYFAKQILNFCQQYSWVLIIKCRRQPLFCFAKCNVVFQQTCIYLYLVCF